jgi:hypothetical protein
MPRVMTVRPGELVERARTFSAPVVAVEQQCDLDEDTQMRCAFCRSSTAVPGVRDKQQRVHVKRLRERSLELAWSAASAVAPESPWFVSPRRIHPVG